jgi:hypothetical protein
MPPLPLAFDTRVQSHLSLRVQEGHHDETRWRDVIVTENKQESVPIDRPKISSEGINNLQEAQRNNKVSK